MPEPRTAHPRATRPDQISTRTHRALGMSGAVAAAAIPAVVLSGLAAAPATAAPATTTVLAPKAASAANIAAAQQRIAADRVAAAVPTRLTVAASVPASVVVRSGDTLSHIAARHKVSLATILKANNIKATDIIRPGQVIKLKGTSTAAPAAKAATPAAAPAAKTYTVVAGDTLSHIAARHKVSLATILSANNIKATDIIRPGQKLTVGNAPASSTPAPAAKAPAAKAPAAAAPAPAAKTYTVVSGDTLSGIASRHNIALSVLLQANNLSSTTVIHPGRKLTISGGTVSSTSSSSTEARPQLVPSTFLHYKYPASTVKSANDNKYELLSRNLPNREQMKQIIVSTANSMGVDPSLALAHAYQESGFNMAAVSPANAIGAMQVIPTSGEWASQLVGRQLDLLDPHDNAVAGVAIIRSLQRTSATKEIGIASYYQGAGSVKRNGMYSDTKRYVASVLAHQKTFK
ncbi:LysM peptidoglycan-binding domain-containing protein [Zafaria sp. Z1313]|uniref:LysM peptidoglycan-binding domain-containing protein n=1 Tax=unclassified Zafaria TaxID=2828765 RepID=UPI002E7A0D23|nr:LysM peptidoglycan-binding domain-containing protein [Zafaria sp. J156]MEE1620302.1 LysM peptidoglycan-binding domain-containing protein [Zafaria sp. J156]